MKTKNNTDKDIEGQILDRRIVWYCNIINKLVYILKMPHIWLILILYESQVIMMN